MKINLFTAASLLTLGFSLASCSSNNETPTPTGAYSSGVFILNEGKFGSPTGSLSFYNRSTKTLTNDVFALENANRPLGDVFQSMTIANNKAYLVVNNSNKIEIADANTLKSVAAPITKLRLPRYMAVVGNKGYVTEWIAFGRKGQLAIFNLDNPTQKDSIPLGNLPNNILKASNNKLYVLNANDNNVAIINPANNTLETNVVVGDRPNSIVQDATGAIWVLCGGTPSWAGTPTNAKLVRFNPNTPTQQTTFNFSSQGAGYLSINSQGNKLYYRASGGVFAMDITATALPTTPLINRKYTAFYGLGIDTDGTIYTADAVNYASAGKVFRFNAQGALLDSMTVGIAPNGFVFK
jgi:YVTN family beta-propeller protein